jgi:hypothetical protein
LAGEHGVESHVRLTSIGLLQDHLCVGRVVEESD